MKIHRRVAVLLFLGLGVGVASRAFAEEAPRVISESLCTVIQKKKISRSASDVVFGEPLDTGPAAKAWALPLKSISIPIPPGSYPTHTMKTMPAPAATFHATLKRSDGLVVQITLEPMRVYSDVFAAAEVAYKHKPADGESRTSSLYGKPPTLLDLESDEYTYKRADLSCADLDTLKLERVIVALVLKSETPWQSSTLHVVGGKSAEAFWGISRFGRYGDHDLWAFERELPLDGILVRVRYSATRRDLIDAIYKGAWVMTAPPDPQTPAWLAQTAARMLDWMQLAGRTTAPR